MSAFELRGTGKVEPAPVKPAPTPEQYEIKLGSTVSVTPDNLCAFCRRSVKQLGAGLHYIDSMVPAPSGYGRIMYSCYGCKLCIANLFTGIAQFYARKEDQNAKK